MLRSHRWPAFQDGRWGNRDNPQIPAGDVRPAGAAVRDPLGLDVMEPPQATAPGSPAVSRSVSSAAHSGSQTIVLSSDREETAQKDMELTVPASPPRTIAPRQASSQAQVAEAVTTMVTQIRKTGATSANASASREDQTSGPSMTNPPTTRIPRVSATESHQPRASGSNHSHSSHRDRSRQSRQPVLSADPNAVRWTAPGATPRWKTKDAESLADMEASVRAVVKGTSDTTFDDMIQYMESFRTHQRLRLTSQWPHSLRQSYSAQR